ncbi:MAG: PAS domain-containing protein [Rhodospirillales bacterium]|nr:PAS domain-containing protein [Rhodospirillales bacterium]
MTPPPAADAGDLDRVRRQIVSPSVEAGFDYWTNLLTGRRFPSRREIDPTVIPRQLLKISLIDVSHDPLDFRIRLVGQHVRDRMGAMAGRRVAETIAPDQGLQNVLNRYTRCVQEARPVRSLFRFRSLIPPHDEIWVEAVSCPLSGEVPDRVDHIVSFAADGDFPTPALDQEVP